MAIVKKLIANQTEISSAPSWETSEIQDYQVLKYHFFTGKKFVNQDIDLKVSVIDAKGTLTGVAEDVTAEASIVATEGFGSTIAPEDGVEGVDYWTITASTTGGSGSFTPKFMVETPGWIGSDVIGTSQNITITGGEEKKFYVLKANSNLSSPIEPGLDEKTLSIGAGYTPGETIVINGISEELAKEKLGQGIIGVAEKDAPELSDFENENTGVIIPSEGYLTLTEGWYPSTKISLATLIPDSYLDKTLATSGSIRNGFFAWDEDGKPVLGTMGNASVKSGEILVNDLVPTFNAEKSLYDVAVSATASAPTVLGSGYIDETVGAKNTNSDVVNNITFAKLETIAKKSADGKVTPVIEAVTSNIEGKKQVVVNKDSADSVSKYYIAVQTAEIKASTDIEAQASAGYSDGSNYTKGAGTVERGANASEVSYFSLPLAQLSIENGNIVVKAPGYVEEGDDVSSSVSGSLNIDGSKISSIEVKNEEASLNTDETGAWSYEIPVEVVGVAKANVGVDGYVNSSNNISGKITGSAIVSIEAYEGDYSVAR